MPATENAKFSVELPIRTRTLGNSRRHWRFDWKAAKEQREAVALVLRCQQPGAKVPRFPVRVKLTRIAPRPLDAFGNLHSSFKAIVDGIADFYMVKDNDPRWVFAEPAQERAKRYAVRIELESV